MATANNKRIEESAVNALKTALLQCPILEAYISSNDKTPSWDGTVFAYKNGEQKKCDLLGRVPVQVKGTEKQIISDTASYSCSLVDLRNYYQDGGCIFFLVSTIPATGEHKIFYVSLLVYDLKKIKVTRHIQSDPSHTVNDQQAQKIVEEVKQELSEDKDLGRVFAENEMPLTAWMLQDTKETHRAAQAKFIPIPRIRITDAGVEEYVFVDFDLDLTEFTHVPIKNELLIQNLEDMQDRQRIKGDAIDFEGYNPKKVILERLREKPEIDYERCRDLLFKLITQMCAHYENKYGENGMQNIVMMFKRDIGNKIYSQMMQHFFFQNGFMQEEIIGTRNYNLEQKHTYEERVNLFGTFTKNIRSVLFDGIKKGVFDTAKFDSAEGELTLARVLEQDSDVINWLRPAPKEFNITYNHGHNYEPDFVVETEHIIFLVEVKGEDKLKAPDVIAKRNRGIQYCEVATRWCRANGYKEWRYLFIPSKQVLPNSSFMQLAERFKAL